MLIRSCIIVLKLKIAGIAVESQRFDCMAETKCRGFDRGCKIALKQGNSGVMRPASGQRDLQEGLLNRSVSIAWQKQNVADLIAVAKLP